MDSGNFTGGFYRFNRFKGFNGEGTAHKKNGSAAEYKWVMTD